MSNALRRASARLLFCVVLVATLRAPSAQVPTGHETTAASVAGYALSADMPVDPEVLVGGLANGLRFYVRPNPKPAGEAEIRLVVRAGSVLEDDDQRGLAHFVEHMQFQGSRHFPGERIDAFLGSIGLNIGSDANAETSFDDTQYSLKVPTSRRGVLDQALTVLEDWAGGALFEDAAIDRQRAIVLAEWRRSLGADERTADKLRKVQLEGSRYADRPPIGDPDVIRTATRDQLVRFYRDWYRPDLMAVIVVGDVDRDNVAAMIRAHFSAIDNPSPERPRPVFDVPEHAATRYAVLTDKESTNTVVSLTDLRPAHNQGSIGGYRDILKDQLFSQMLGDRLDETAQGAQAPFLRAAAGRNLFPAPKTRDQAALQALVPADGVTRGLDALVTALKRVATFGFTATELERAKQANMAVSERAAEESPDRESASRADEYTRNFLEREALPTIWQELAFHRRFMPEITLKEMNALAADWFPQTNRLVVAMTPEVSGRTLPTESQLAAAVAAASARTVTAYVDTTAGKALMDHPPAKGSIVKTVQKGTVTEWTLSNGATVALLPTMLKADQILFRASAPGGTSLASDADFPAAASADDIIPAGGAGAFTETAIERMMNGKALAVQPYINEIREGMNGGAAPRDLEAMFQLLYLRFTAPRADPTVFAAMQQRALALLADQSASPDVLFDQTITAALSGNHPRRQPLTPATVAQWNLEKSLAFYKARFADASNFTFVFVGSFTLDQIRPLVETYLATLPSISGARVASLPGGAVRSASLPAGAVRSASLPASSGRSASLQASDTHETFRDLGIRPPTGVVETTIKKGIAPKSEVAIVFSGPFTYTPQANLALQTATLILQGRLSDAIREELGATYAISADAESNRYPQPEYRVKIQWTCDPAQVDTLVARVFKEVAAVRDTPIKDDQMSRIRAYLTRELDRSSQENGYFLNQILRRYETGAPLDQDVVRQRAAEIAALTGGAVTQAAVTYLDPARYVRVTLMPEK
ncbi:MAG TPA: insulinase family protein [Vicinamibacterales bacterium]|nr:insulinase family protein [Vicinamibacterales bacterium]